MQSARVILVDDDVSIRRLAKMALEELPIELVLCAGAVEALEALRQAPARLLITDLMMPGMSGLDLLRQLTREPALRGGARLMVYSAGLNAEARAQMAGLDVWRELPKPVSVLVLMAAVEEALADAAAGPRAASAEAVQEAPLDEADTIRTHFAGDGGLFQAFRAGCAAQFQDDLGRLQAAFERRDGGDLRRLGHSLKSVLQLLGLPRGATEARRLELAATAGDWAACERHGAALRSALEPLATAPGAAGVSRAAPARPART